MSFCETTALPHIFYIILQKSINYKHFFRSKQPYQKVNNKCNKNFLKIDFRHTSHFTLPLFGYIAHFKVFFRYTVHFLSFKPIFYILFPTTNTPSQQSVSLIVLILLIVFMLSYLTEFFLEQFR